MSSPRRRIPYVSIVLAAVLAVLGLTLSCESARGPEPAPTAEAEAGAEAAPAGAERTAATAEGAGDDDADAGFRDGSDADVCAPGTLCLKVDPDGTRNSGGTSVAQCSGTFPDYVVEADLFPDGYAGPWFFAASDFPASPDDGGDRPWEAIDFEAGQEGADAYAFALRDYAFEGNVEVDFRVQDNPLRTWVTVPYMNYGPGRRELVRGLTRERTLRAPELGIRPGVSVRNYAIGFYNGPGGFTIGQVWSDPWVPDLGAATFPDGAMVFKILFSDAVPEDFTDPASYPLTGSPEWQIATGDGELTTVRLMQMDVAVRDPRSQPTGWVYGTFAFDPDADDPVAWNRLRPVGVQWGNAPGYTPQDETDGVPLPDNTISELSPAYALGHLGWAGRLNGPVDNPASACMSCHGTAQYPVAAAMIPPSGCTTEEKLHWFRNLPVGEPFGDVDGCTPVAAEGLQALDTSLQLQVSLQSILQYADVNPCLDPADAPTPAVLRREAMPGVGPGVREGAPRVTRDGLGGEIGDR